MTSGYRGSYLLAQSGITRTPQAAKRQANAMTAESIYQAVDGTHTYRLEINHVNGSYQLGALRFYRDGVLEGEDDSILPYLSDANEIRFVMGGDDPVGATHTWDDMAIHVASGRERYGPSLEASCVSLRSDCPKR